MKVVFILYFVSAFFISKAQIQKQNTFTDPRDGELYKTVKIGEQLWMAENLRYKVEGSYLHPNNPSEKYGRLYSWMAVMNGDVSDSTGQGGVQGICPSGWHVPSDAEWDTLELTLGMQLSDVLTFGARGIHGKQMKSTTEWQDYFEEWEMLSGNGSNSSGFNAFPAGKYYWGTFYYFGYFAYFWTSTKNHNGVLFRKLASVNEGVTRNALNSGDAYSCRCLAD